MNIIWKFFGNVGISLMKIIRVWTSGRFSFSELGSSLIIFRVDVSAWKSIDTHFTADSASSVERKSLSVLPCRHRHWLTVVQLMSASMKSC